MVEVRLLELVIVRKHGVAPVIAQDLEDGAAFVAVLQEQPFWLPL